MQNLSHAIRKFNRFELKYLVSLRQAEAFRHALAAHLSPDDHGDANGVYNLSSLYFDSPDYRCYWEKIDGIKYRRKLRIRWYETGQALHAETPVFVEIKQRMNRVTQKRRALLSYADALRLCSQREAPRHDPQDDAFIDEVLSLGWQYNLHPASVVRYSRLALVGGEDDIGLRVTFDRDLRYQAKNLELDSEDSGLFMFPPEWAVVEIKVNERIPYWLTELVAEHNLNLMRVSKYCRSIEMSQKINSPFWQSIPN
jgi:hypothetical protein